MTPIIRILDQTFYAGPVGVASEGVSALTHQGWLRNKSGELSRAWLKLFTSPDRQFVNEITGYLIARHLGLPVPPEAYIVHVPIKDLSRIHPQISLPTDRPTLPLWATKDLEGKSARYTFNAEVPSPSLQTDLQGWDFLPDAVAFDEWVANIDRNLQNLIYLGKHRWGLIDHGGLMGGPQWSPDSLDPTKRHHNLLALIAWHSSPMLKKQEDAILIASEAHPLGLGNALAELKYWWGRLLEPEEASAAEAFINDRLATVPEHFKGDFQRVC